MAREYTAQDAIVDEFSKTVTAHAKEKGFVCSVAVGFPTPEGSVKIYVFSTTNVVNTEMLLTQALLQVAYNEPAGHGSLREALDQQAASKQETPP
jgi:hypothetical protein